MHLHKLIFEHGVRAEGWDSKQLAQIYLKTKIPITQEAIDNNFSTKVYSTKMIENLQSITIPRKFQMRALAWTTSRYGV